ncbi:hypothetical protein RRG08_037169 [Elysia crispata]|uniref:Uncharacterized protein n=1 Tax=Elysia crispata TaxID=231223 RepID=A0AAE0Z4P0_9GAST|nr:hypothetical protein RRG08_037169 [Elysia crispata]
MLIIGLKKNMAKNRKPRSEFYRQPIILALFTVLVPIETVNGGNGRSSPELAEMSNRSQLGNSPRIDCAATGHDASSTISDLIEQLLITSAPRVDQDATEESRDAEPTAQESWDWTGPTSGEITWSPGGESAILRNRKQLKSQEPQPKVKSRLTDVGNPFLRKTKGNLLEQVQAQVQSYL